MNEEKINVEEIMQHIREQIIVRKTAESPGNIPLVKLSGQHLPSEFYEHLYHASLLHNQIDVQIHLTPTATPIVGSFLHRLRQMIHEVVVFYVNKLAAQQIEVNQHLLRAVSILGEEMEKMQEAEEEIRE